MTTASDVFAHHLEAFGAGNIDDILADYTEHTVMIYGDKVWRGLAGARDFFHMWLDELLPAGCRFDLIDSQAVDDLVYITWTAESQDFVFDYGTDTFLIENSNIVRQTVATLQRRK
jgi:hypothetical protein